MSNALVPLPSPSLTLPATRRLKEPGVSRLRRVTAAARAPRVMLVSEEAMLRLEIGRELVSGFELIPTLGTASADRRLDAGAAPQALIVDLDTGERAVVQAFLARLVERGFAGPRILLSERFTPGPVDFRDACLTHFALPRPWRPGALRALVETVLCVPSVPRAAAAGL